MQVFKYIERINLLDKLISQRKTGTPECLARRLDLSVSRLARIIEYLREMNVPIEYDRALQTYYYSVEYKLHIDVQMKPLTEVEAKYHNAGSRIGFSFFHSIYHP